MIEEDTIINIRFNDAAVKIINLRNQSRGQFRPERPAARPLRSLSNGITNCPSRSTRLGLPLSSPLLLSLDVDFTD